MFKREIALLLILICVTLPSSVSAGALTSIKIGSKIFNLRVLDRTENEEAIKVFNDALVRGKKTAIIKSCTFAIDLLAGTARGNHSYGGFCSSLEDKKTNNVIICADIMVGHLKMQPIEYSQYSDDGINFLAKFVADNCTGG